MPRMPKKIERRLILPSGEPIHKPRHVFGKERAKDEVPTLETNLEETIGVRKWLVSGIADAERQIGALKLANRGRVKTSQVEGHLVGMQLISDWMQAQLTMVDAALDAKKKLDEEIKNAEVPASGDTVSGPVDAGSV